MTEEEKERYAAGFAVQVGIDTGKTFHKLVARRPGDIRPKPFKVTVDRAGFDAAGDLPGREARADARRHRVRRPSRFHLR